MTMQHLVVPLDSKWCRAACSARWGLSPSSWEPTPYCQEWLLFIALLPIISFSTPCRPTWCLTCASPLTSMWSRR